MAIDGLTVYALNKELENDLINGHIKKIYQPQKNLITINIRKPGKDYKPLISASPNDARVHLTDEKFENPKQPPAFCMLLRKYFENGRIVKLKQPDFDRIIRIEITKKNEFGKVNTVALFIEIMGRHSNLIAVDNTNTILDGLIHITEKISSYRQILPNIKYKPPPPQNKLHPLKIDYNQFRDKIIETGCNIKNFRLIMHNIKGFGPVMSKEVLFRAGFETEEKNFNPDKNNIKKLWHSFKRIIKILKNKEYQPTIYYNYNNNSVPEIFSIFNLTHLTEDKLKKKNFENISLMLEYYFKEKESMQKLNSLEQSLYTVIKNNLKKEKKRQTKLKPQLKKAQKASEYQKKGELITANIYKINKGMKKIAVEDYFHSDNKEVVISLDPNLEPAENAQLYFKKYTKAKRSKKILENRIQKVEQEIEYLDKILYSLQNAESLDELNEIRKELVNEGYITEKSGENIGSKNLKSEPYKFKSDEFLIYVGKNNYQNDLVTFNYAQPDDLWLHVKELPGSHVIIKNHTRDPIPEITIKHGAQLAAYFSKGRTSSNVPVDYTKKKYVKKPPGSKPGMVTYSKHKTFFVTPSKKDLLNIRTQ